MERQPNDLQRYLIQQNLSEVLTMNWLQDHGIISDNCVDAVDVANCSEAISSLDAHLQKNGGKL